MQRRLDRVVIGEKGRGVAYSPGVVPIFLSLFGVSDERPAAGIARDRCPHSDVDALYQTRARYEHDAERDGEPNSEPGGLREAINNKERCNQKGSRTDAYDAGISKLKDADRPVVRAVEHDPVTAGVSQQLLQGDGRRRESKRVQSDPSPAKHHFAARLARRGVSVRQWPAQGELRLHALVRRDLPP